MADNSKIEWCDATWQPITGCSVTSPGCTNCFAMKLAGTRMRNHSSRAGLTQDGKSGPVWTGEVRFNERWLDQPLRWRKPRRIFVCAHGDLFHEAVPDEWIDWIFAVMSLTPQHTYLVLTKRAKRMRKYFTVTGSNDDPDAVHQRILSAAYDLLGDRDRDEATRLRDLCEASEPSLPLPNVWLGFSAEDQQWLVERWRDAGQLAEQGWRVWCSAEPLLGPLDLMYVETVPDSSRRTGIRVNILTGYHRESGIIASRYKLSWFVAGSESGLGARPCDIEWVRSLRDQCSVAGVPFFWKQHVENGRKISLPELDGRKWAEFPV